MVNKIIFALILASLFGLSACRKEAGKGGKAIIHVRLVNDIYNVPNCMVHVKYGANAYAQNTTYDDSIQADASGKADFTNLRRGDYYFYAEFTDSAGLHRAGDYIKINNKPGETHTVIDFAEADPF